MKIQLPKKQALITVSLLACVVVSYQNCQQTEDFYEKTLDVAPVVEAPDLTPPVEEGPTLCENGSTDDLICNPLGGDVPSKTPRAGLIASLYEGKENFSNFNIYLTDGYRHPESIYFSNFNVPARSFSEGFSIGENDFLKTQKGSKLIEWFAIEAKGNLVLPKDKEEGFYHIVTISDDGIIVKVDEKTIISNPTNHAPQIDCAKELVEMTKDSEKPFELGYYQGPRYTIALMTFIKKVDPTTYKKSALCSKAGNVQALLDEGYSVISPDWFTLPDGY